ncbi:MAG: hypothetical protein HWN65_01310 [Candidatus Helarchaeota archaeon]|nr:hypothetical protein [Candidatus Helarchaeota archaeon]
MNLSEFKKLWDKLGTTEEGAIKCYIIGAIEYVNGNDDGEKMCAMTIPKNYLNKKGLLGPSEKYLLTHMKEQPDTPKSYLGGTPENDYAYSYDNDLVVLENKSQRGEKSSKLFIQSGGKDFPTPVRLRKNKHGYWKLFSTGSIATGVKETEDDDF